MMILVCLAASVAVAAVSVCKAAVPQVTQRDRAQVRHHEADNGPTSTKWFQTAPQAAAIADDDEAASDSASRAEKTGICFFNVLCFLRMDDRSHVTVCTRSLVPTNSLPHQERVLRTRVGCVSRGAERGLGDASRHRHVIDPPELVDAAPHRHHPPCMCHKLTYKVANCLRSL